MFSFFEKPFSIFCNTVNVDKLDSCTFIAGIFSLNMRIIFFINIL